jgi:hypothetical protein
MHLERQRNMNNLRTVFLSIAITLGLVGTSMFAGGLLAPASAQDSEPAPAVRFVHVYSGGGPVDVYVDSALVVEQLAFGTATEYATFDEGDRQVQVVATGEDPSAALIDTTISVDSGGAYNVLIGGQGEELDARVHEVDLGELDPGEARIRFIQAAPDVSEASFQLAAPSTTEAGSDTTDDDTTDDDGGLAPGDMIGIGESVAFNEAGDYQTVRAATYDILVQDTESDASLLETPLVSLDAGHVYDIVVLGRVESDNLTLLPLITSVSPPCSELLQVGEASDACVRFVHTSADAGEVDIYVDGTAVVQAISYGTVTEFLALQQGDHQIQVVPTGQAVDGAWLDETMGFDAQRAYQFSIDGIAMEDDNDDNDLSLNRNDIDLSPLPTGQARIRAVHTVADANEVSVALMVGTPLFEGVSFNDASDYAVVDAGTYDL